MGNRFQVGVASRRTPAAGAALIAGGAMLNACPQLRDEDFRTLPSSGLNHSDAGGGAGGAAVVQPAAPDAGVESPNGRDARIAALRAALAHRYAFEGTGTVAVDTIAGSDATLVNATLDGNGSLSLDGVSGYVDLPNGVLSAADEQTIEAWLTWKGGRAWQRIFDFGSNDAGEGERGNGRTYLFLTPRSAEDRMLLAYTATGYFGETRLSAGVAFPTNVLAHVSVVIDSSDDSLSLYLDGRQIAARVLEGRLSQIDDVNCWIGVGQYDNDPHLNATLAEFRLYHRALTSDELELSHALGPDPDW